MFEVLTVGNKEYKCKLTASAMVNLERKWGKNPVSIFIDMVDGDELPKLEPLLEVVHASLQKFNHGIGWSDVLDLYDDFIDDGNSIRDLIQFCFRLFKEAGYISSQEETTGEDETKNQ